MPTVKVDNDQGQQCTKEGVGKQAEEQDTSNALTTYQNKKKTYTYTYTRKHILKTKEGQK